MNSKTYMKITKNVANCPYFPNIKLKISKIDCNFVKIGLNITFW